jgi:hypothetical protein
MNREEVMNMTRKDYVLLSNAIANGIDDASGINGLTGYAIIQRIADALATDNPRFDRERFIKACNDTPATIRARREEITAQLA